MLGRGIIRSNSARSHSKSMAVSPISLRPAVNAEARNQNPHFMGHNLA